MNIEALTEQVFDSIQEAAFEDFQENCIGCDYLLKTPDGYGTGDSPTVYECEVDDNKDCPVVVEFIQDIKNNYQEVL